MAASTDGMVCGLGWGCEVRRITARRERRVTARMDEVPDKPSRKQAQYLHAWGNVILMPYFLLRCVNWEWYF